MKELDNVMLCRAANLANKAHQGQMRKGGKQPYIIHPERVVTRLHRLYEAGDSRITTITLCKGWLHDVREDCPWITDAEIIEATNEEVLKGVINLTNPSKNFKPTPEQLQMPKGSIRRIKKEMDRLHIAGIPWDDKLVKLADRLDNVSDMEGIEREFCLLYANESEMLLNESLRHIHIELEQELEEAIRKLRKR